MASWWRGIAPIAVAVIIALMPTPPGLPQYAWYYFAIFSGADASMSLRKVIETGAGGLVNRRSGVGRWREQTMVHAATP